LWLESSEEHLPTSIAGVLRLRAISRPLCNRSARRFAQDDGFVGGEKDPVSYAENTKRSKKSQALGMTKGLGGVSFGSRRRWMVPARLTALCNRSRTEKIVISGTGDLNILQPTSVNQHRIQIPEVDRG
jgi:hypothetical protein